MLPTATDNGGRLAAIVPTGLAALALGNDLPAAEMLRTAVGGEATAAAVERESRTLALIPPLRSLVVIAVDGLGSANLKARRGHAPNLSALPQRRITTVTPSTTGAALTTLTTGRLPAEHGLVGYRIMHPTLGLLSPLRDWGGIADVRRWQHAKPLFELASQFGLRARTYGRPAHSESGLTRAILSGAEYVGGDTIADRLSAAARDLRSPSPLLAYVYVDELDRAGHQNGWQSRQWSDRLEQLDRALGDFLTSLPPHTGVILTADHGMVDIESHQQIVFDHREPAFAHVTAVGGEPRFRTFFMDPAGDVAALTAWLEAREGKRAWIGTRDEAFAAGLFGDHLTPGVVERVGDVILAARGQCAYYMTTDDEQSLEMVGQHGSLTDEERGIPLVLAGALAGSGFAKAVETLAAVHG